MPIYTEEDLQNAVKQAKIDNNVSKALRDFGVPRSSIRDRLKDSTTYQKAHSEEQNLTAIQKTQLAK